MFFIFFTLKWKNHGENSFSIVNYVFSSFMGFELGENLYDILLLICCPFFKESLCEFENSDFLILLYARNGLQTHALIFSL